MSYCILQVMSPRHFSFASLPRGDGQYRSRNRSCWRSLRYTFVFTAHLLDLFTWIVWTKPSMYV